MTNSDNTFGTFNKITKIAAQPYDGSTALTTFSSVNEAKAFYFTSDALAVFDECCTQLQWEVINDARGDATSLKWTMTFGTKGTGTSESDDWAAQYISRQTALINAPLKSHSISGAVQADNGSADGSWIVTITAAGHNFTVGDLLEISGVEGMTKLNDTGVPVASVDGNTFTVIGAEGYGASHTYTSGGTAKTCTKNKWSNNTSETTTDSSHLF